MFLAGFLLNLGELAYRKEEKIMIMPLSGRWSLAASQTSSQRSARSVSLSLARWVAAARVYITLELRKQLTALGGAVGRARERSLRGGSGRIVGKSTMSRRSWTPTVTA